MKISTTLARKLTIYLFAGLELFIKHSDRLLKYVGLTFEPNFRDGLVEFTTSKTTWEGTNSAVPVEWWPVLAKFFAGNSTPTEAVDELFKIGKALSKPKRRELDGKA